MRRARLLFAPVVLASLLACGQGAPELVSVQLTLALEFGTDALLEVFVVDAGAADCGALSSGAVDAEASAVEDGIRRVPASRLNNGGEAAIDFDELPAEAPLVFYARARGGDQTVLADACQGDVVIPNGGHVDVELKVTER